MTDFLQRAAPYVAMGLPILPILPDGKVPPGIDECVRHGLLREGQAGGCYMASTDPALHARWSEIWPTANVAVRTGAESGIDVVDLDEKPEQGKAGVTWLREKIEKHGPMPKAPLARTPSGGYHLWFATEPRLGCRVGGAKSKHPGVDTRGEGGYIVAPGSVRPGGAYRWERALRGRSLPRMPEWLVQYLLPPPPPKFTAQQISDPEWVEATIGKLVDAVRTAPKGERNHTLNAKAFIAFGLARAAEKPLGDVYAAMEAAAHAQAADQKDRRRHLEIKRTLQSAMLDSGKIEIKARRAA